MPIKNAKKYVPQASSEYPVNDPLWASFLKFVEYSGVVRKELFKGHKENWKIVWAIFQAGAIAEYERVTS